MCKSISVYLAFNKLSQQLDATTEPETNAFTQRVLPAPFGVEAFTVKSVLEIVSLPFHRCDMACAYTHGAHFSGFMHLRFV